MAGDNFYTMDSNGRVTIPVKFRELLGESVQITRGIGEPCLYVYSKENWEIQKRKILDKGSSVNLRKIRRFFLGMSEELPLDKQGRITIPKDFRTYADLSKKLFIADVGDHIEIWDKDKWDEEVSIDPMDISAIWEEFDL